MAVAKAKPDMVKVEKYGETNEGRGLILAYISIPQNLQQLESIRLNNLRIAGLTKDKAAPVTTGAPAIVWLSYNVHGNEPSSSEAAMQTLYALADPGNKQTKEWLQNTIVIIDPCMNPDGRDRYVNWYNSVVGKNYNADPQSREHNEPWPGGRSNHYNFDLNRDWAWQTQTESWQRMKQYNAWMPQVHVDFHEQGYNEPYYFAPAAEPYHEVITQWQRDFQVMIGKNNARYFDGNGWLYFTKERFDLFYPSYGDTYPLYNGAIGMTFEQGGHSRGGLGVVKDDGDTLTLGDRIQHHYTTGLSTIETTSKNAQRVIDEYKNFFDNNRNAKNALYVTYVVSSSDANKIAAVKDLLNKNAIEYTPVQGRVKGFRYFTGKEEEAQLDTYSIAVSMYQPKSSLVRVLFEPTSKLSDSATYDITAWSIPYAYGVEGYALKDRSVKEASPTEAVANKADTSTTTPYGFLVPYTSLNSARMLAYLLKNDVKVRFAEKPFTSNNKNYDRGTLIVLKTNNNGNYWARVVREAAKQFNIPTDMVATGFMDKGADFGSPDIKFITAPKVALLTGEQVSSTDAGEVWNLFDQVLDYPVSLFNAADLQRVNLKNYTVLILPDGYYRNLNDKPVVDKLKEFVRSGGKIIALQGAVQQMAGGDWGLKMKEDKADENAAKKDDYASLKKYADRNNEYLTNTIPGAIYKVELDNTHPLAFGYPGYYYTLKQDPNLYEFLKDGWNVGVIKKDSYVTGFTGSKLKPKLKDGLLFGVDEMGNGSIVYLSDNPLFRLFWENGKLLFCNAVFLVGQ
ncbi:peptidase M14 carboxypeptidase A [Russula earlei]|uniref:Peptidase M14 carboxypeptidase A n=1 Tax=Russula earlei TaxID=71964 RepID=A0ACC0TTB6_9AGAM|nr:peptidase M14 carboxypeptidase A [Russula earlei]